MDDKYRCDTTRWLGLAYIHIPTEDLVLAVWTFRPKTGSLCMEYYLILEYL
jgi:hypothetical protein